MKQLLVVVVLIWHRCVNENYSFTKAGQDYKLETFEYGDRSNISCEQSVIKIESISIEDKNTVCPLSDTCYLTDNVTNEIKRNCDGTSSCSPIIKLPSTCITNTRYVTLSYACSETDFTCNFEKNATCHWLHGNGWERIKASQLNDRPQQDTTTKSEFGYYLHTQTSSNLTSKPIRSKKRKCLVFWFNISNSGPGMHYLLMVHQVNPTSTQTLWTSMGQGTHTWMRHTITLTEFDFINIVFEAKLKVNGKEYVALDDIDLLNLPCLVSESKTTFEQGLENWHILSSTSGNWTLQAAYESNPNKSQPSTDYTTESKRGHYLSFHMSGSGRIASSYTLPTGSTCLNLWYNMNGNGIGSFNIIQNIATKMTVIKTIKQSTQGKWKEISLNLPTNDRFQIILEGNLTNNSDSSIAVDDSSIKDGICQDQTDTCVSKHHEHSIQCPEETYNRQISVTFEQLDNTSVCFNAEYELEKNINAFCKQEKINNNNSVCQFILNQFSSNDKEEKECFVFNSTIVSNIEYYCIPVESTMSEVKGSTRQPVENEDSTLATEMQTGLSTLKNFDIKENIPASSPSSSPVIGIVIGVILSLVVMSVLLVIAVIYFRRVRYADKKGHSIVANDASHTDYTGHQNTAFLTEVNVTTQTNYCEIRKSKLNEHYHDISDTFSPTITTTNDDEYSEIANVVNSTNSNPNPSTNYQHQYISLDPDATGFDRSNPHTNLHKESRNNYNSNEIISFTGGDDYAILDPNDLNESKNNTPKVLPLSDNYVVLDPNETGFNRQENTAGVCNYELATSINPTETSEDPYDVSKDETYDTSSNSRHKEKENNIYSHMVDNVYDTAGNQRKKEQSDATYDHFFGQQSEDNYDISKPL